MLRLHDYWRSSACYRVRIALALKGVDYESVPVNLLVGEQAGAVNAAANPQKLIPALLLDDGTVLTQSLAIVDWLDAAYPEPRLIPADPLLRARALAIALAVAAEIHPLTNLRVQARLASQFGADAAARDDWYRHWVSEGLDALEAMAGDGPFLAGDAPGVADLCLVPQMYNARRFAVPLDRCPRLADIDARASALPAFAAAHPDRFKPVG
jgi:maleylacetoacetate isomerase